jgi:hypothetical protein
VFVVPALAGRDSLDLRFSNESDVCLRRSESAHQSEGLRLEYNHLDL